MKTHGATRTSLQAGILLAAFLSLVGAGAVPSVHARQALPENAGEGDTVPYAAEPVGGAVLSNGQFVYGPNVKDFEVSTYLSANAPHILAHARPLYERSRYFGINPKIYLTLMEMHAQVLSKPDAAALANPLGLGAGDFISQVERVSRVMTDAYYRHLYSYSALPVYRRRLPPLFTPGGIRVEVTAGTNAATYAILAGLAAMDERGFSSLLDTSDAHGFRATYLRLFGDDPLDDSNHVDIPGEPGALAAPGDLLQLPWLRGSSWFFGGVHSNGGAVGGPFTDASALDFGPGGLAWGADTSGAWVVAAAAGTPTRISDCYLSIAHADGWETTYYHIENIQVFSGDVGQNDKVAVLADTLAEATCSGGRASGPHVHFNLKHNGALVAIDGTPLSGWYVHAGRWNYDTDPNYMWLERAGAKVYPNVNKVLSEVPPSAPGDTVSVTFSSVAARDGWILESAENSSTGGTLNRGSTTVRVGDEAGDRQYRSILHFDTSSLPEGAVITNAQLRLMKQGLKGRDPFLTHKSLLMDIKAPSFKRPFLELADFRVAASPAGSFSSTPVGGWHTATLPSTVFPLVNLTGTAEFRIRFSRADNDNNAADYVRFYSGNAAAPSAPQLIVEYHLP